MTEQQKSESSSVRNILIAMDGSDYSKYAFDWYLQNMHQDSDNVILVHSVEYHDVMQNKMWFYGFANIDEGSLASMLDVEAQKLRKELEHYAQMMRDAKIHGTVKSVHASKPGEGIVKAADDCNATVIITGSRGKGKIQRKLIGSTSDYIMHHSHVPVIVCRNKELQHQHHHHHFHLFGHHHHHDKEHHGSSDSVDKKHH